MGEDLYKSLFQREAERLRDLNKDKNQKESLGAKIGGWFVAILMALVLFAFVITPLTVYYALSYALVTTKLWAWFVVPTFGVAQISFVAAMGLMLLVRVCTHQTHINTNKDERSTLEKVSHMVGLLIAPWFTLLFGYIIHRFM